jgi:hypothetical protein
MRLFEATPRHSVLVGIGVPMLPDVDIDVAVNKDVALVTVAAVVVIPVVKVGAGRVAGIVDIDAFNGGRLDLDHLDPRPFHNWPIRGGIAFDHHRRRLRVNRTPGAEGHGETTNHCEHRKAHCGSLLFTEMIEQA